MGAFKDPPAWIEFRDIHCQWWRRSPASLILTSNLPFSGWGEVFGNYVVASVMIDRIVHHAEVITLKGSSYRLKNTSMTLPSEKQENKAQ